MLRRSRATEYTSYTLSALPAGMSGPAQEARNAAKTIQMQIFKIAPKF